MNLPIYMDYHATTPCDPRVVDVMVPYFTQQFGNASSHGHFFGWQAAEAVKIAREEVAALIHADPSEIVFTSGATEAINLALKGVFELLSFKGKHVITVSTEHRAVLDTCAHLEKLGAEVSYLPVATDGLLDPETLKSAIRPDTILIVVMYANNETGVIQPIRLISELAKQHGILFFTDATQALGKIPVDVLADGIDLLACSAHKIYGPKGVGALYIRRKNPRVRLTAQMDGGGQEKGFRSGTPNVPGIVGFGKAAAIAAAEMDVDMTRIGKLRDKLEQGLLAAGNSVEKIGQTRPKQDTVEGLEFVLNDNKREPEYVLLGKNRVVLNGNASYRLATVSNLSFLHIAGNQLLERLLKDIAISSGSACSSASPELSHVLKAMGLNDELAYHAIRFSLGKYNTEEEVNYVIDKVKLTLKEIGNRKIVQI